MQCDLIMFLYLIDQVYGEKVWKVAQDQDRVGEAKATSRLIHRSTSITRSDGRSGGWVRDRW